MPIVRSFNLGGLNLRVSPFLTKDGDMIRNVNVTRDTIGAWMKRPGYSTYLQSLGTKVDGLFNWTLNNGTQFWNYAVSGGTLFYSTQGTGQWTVCGNGTFSPGVAIGHAVTANTMLVGDGVGSTRHTTNGTSFTNTTGAPIANYFVDYQNRIYAGGTGSSYFYSVAGTPTDWTSLDSSSLAIPGAGKINSTFKSNDRAVITKNSGNMFRWDGYSLVDLTTDHGPTSWQSQTGIENYQFYLNRMGICVYGGDRPEVISNPIRRQIWSEGGTPIAGTTFDNAPAGAYKHNYYLSAGTICDDLTRETTNNTVLAYDFPLNEWRNYDMGTLPTAYLEYLDTAGNEQLVFGDNGGQCYTYGGTATTDNGQPIQVTLELVIHGDVPETEKKWKWFWAFFNPGNQAHVQVAWANTFTREKLKWVDLGDCSDGMAEFHFPEGARGRLLFVKIVESSTNNRFQFYGFAYDAEPIQRG